MTDSADEVDVLIIGAGISGIGGAAHLRMRCPDTSFAILEAQASFGGTWLTHRFPGIRSDSDLYTYGYGFKPWMGPAIATADEIRAYMAEVIEEHRRQPIGHLVFLADAPLLIAAANFGAIMGLELVPASGSGKLSAELLWQQSLLSNVGRLAATGDGRMILASCYTHGIQRFDLEGNSEGAYHPGGSVTHACPDFVGRTIAVAKTATTGLLGFRARSSDREGSQDQRPF